MRKLGLILLLIVAVGLLLPLGMGRLVQQRLQNFAAYFSNNHFFTLQLVDFKRGWFSSEAEWTIEIKNLNTNLLISTFTSMIDQGDVEQIKITIHSTITHGPIIFSQDNNNHWQIDLALAKSTVKIDVPTNSKQPAAPLFYVIGRINLDESIQVDLYGDSIHYANDNADRHSKLDMQQFHAGIFLKRDHQNALIQIHCKPFYLIQDDLALELDELQVNMRVKGSTFAFWPGHTELSIPKLSLYWQIPILHINALQLDLDGENSLDKLDSLLSIKLKELSFFNTKVGPGEVMLELNHVNLPGLAALWEYLVAPMDDTVTINPEALSPRENSKDPIWKLLTDVTQNSSKLALTIKHFNTSYGLIDLHAAITLPGSNQLTPKNFDSWAQQIKYDFSLHATIDLVENCLMTFMKSDLGSLLLADDEDLSNLAMSNMNIFAAEATKSILTKWLLLGAIDIIDDEIFTVIHYQNDELLINGKVVPELKEPQLPVDY